jgi:hypothetical protein
VEVYARGQDNALWEDFWAPGKGWSGEFSLGGSYTGDPAAVADPNNGNVEVYARGGDSALWEDFWTSGTGWSGAFSLGGTLP